MHSTCYQRLSSLLAGEQLAPPATSFFGHVYEVERDPETLANHLVSSQKRFGWDFIKVQSRASYYCEAWGSRYRYDPQDGPIMEEHVVHQCSDYMSLGVLDVDRGPFGEHVRLAQLLADRVKGDVPCIHTVFSPVTVLSRLRGAIPLSPTETDQFRIDIHEAPDAVRHGLEVVTETLVRYVRQLVRTGADGIFVSNTAWDADHLTENEYRTWIEPYDRQVIEAARDAGSWLNIMHSCRPNTHFEITSKYPVEIYSYDCLSGRNPTLNEALSKTDKVLWSGVGVSALGRGDPEELRSQIETALKQTGGRRLVIGPTCGVPTSVLPSTLDYISATVRELSNS